MPSAYNDIRRKWDETVTKTVRSSIQLGFNGGWKVKLHLPLNLYKSSLRFVWQVVRAVAYEWNERLNRKIDHSKTFFFFFFTDISSPFSLSVCTNRNAVKS